MTMCHLVDPKAVDSQIRIISFGITNLAVAASGGLRWERWLEISKSRSLTFSYDGGEHSVFAALHLAEIHASYK